MCILYRCKLLVVFLFVQYRYKFLLRVFFVYFSLFVLIKVNWGVFICVLNAYNIYKKKNCLINLTYSTTDGLLTSLCSVNKLYYVVFLSFFCIHLFPTFFTVQVFQVPGFLGSKFFQVRFQVLGPGFRSSPFPIFSQLFMKISVGWNHINPLNRNPTKCSNILKQLSVFDHFVEFVLKGLSIWRIPWKEFIFHWRCRRTF